MDTELFDILLSLPVIFFCIIHEMTIAINLYRKLILWGIEINNKWTDAILATEFATNKLAGS